MGHLPCARAEIRTLSQTNLGLGGPRHTSHIITDKVRSHSSIHLILVPVREAKWEGAIAHFMDKKTEASEVLRLAEDGTGVIGELAPPTTRKLPGGLTPAWLRSPVDVPPGAL